MSGWITDKLPNVELGDYDRFWVAGPLNDKIVVRELVFINHPAEEILDDCGDELDDQEWSVNLYDEDCYPWHYVGWAIRCENRDEEEWFKPITSKIIAWKPYSAPEFNQ